MRSPYYRHFDIVDSTNDYASELLNEFPYVAVSADYQTKGRGRKGKEWIGEHGQNLYISFGIDHEKIKDRLPVHNYQMAASLMVLDTLREIDPNNKYLLKYPNDIWAIQQEENAKLKGKVSGTITEHVYNGSKCKTTVIGIGTNVNQVTFPDRNNNKPVSLKKLTGEFFDIDELIKILIEKANLGFFESGTNVFETWKEELDIVGKEVFNYSDNTEYKIINLLDDGRLYGENKSGEKIYINNGDTIRYGEFYV